MIVIIVMMVLLAFLLLYSDSYIYFSELTLDYDDSYHHPVALQSYHHHDLQRVRG